MDSQKYCVYNETRESFLSLDVTMGGPPRVENHTAWTSRWLMRGQVNLEI